MTLLINSTYNQQASQNRTTLEIIYMDTNLASQGPMKC